MDLLSIFSNNLLFIIFGAFILGGVIINLISKMFIKTGEVAVDKSISFFSFIKNLLITIVKGIILFFQVIILGLALLLAFIFRKRFK